MGLTPPEMNALRWDWHFWGRPDQLEPSGDWSVWLAMAGRGYGKTRLGAEWVREQMCGKTPLAPGNHERIAIVAETAADGRDVMIQGPSGILACHPPEFRPIYKKSQRVLEWPNGATALTFSAEEPDQLRGPNFSAAWSDEPAKWQYSQETWDMLQFTLRIGANPRQVVTTTPRPIPLIRELLRSEGKPNGTYVTRGSTYDNADNLSPKFIAKMRERYEGTRLGRQELLAEVLDDLPNALWTRALLERRHPGNALAALMAPDERLPDMARVVVGVDPSGTNGEDDSADSVGIVVAGRGMDGVFYVLEDATCDLGPSGWSRVVVEQYDKYAADLVVGERNYGGAMVEFTVRTASRDVNYKDVKASRGKAIRAEPVAALYERGRCRHVRSFTELEDQLLSFTRTGYFGDSSPDRADALVWALTELAFEETDYDPAMYGRLVD